ncbi:MAG: hypothetical protein GY750_10590 [Lentisphaerae bacterium]|nr:hypothetical protein [Lentisphaerota bacterium]MCP4101858.1 hypothetical protein [Lentisphaerota bacterium]
MNLKLLKAITLLVTAGTLTAATLVYKTSKNKEEKTVSDIEIVSIDKGSITIKRGKSQKTIPLRWVQKYYSTDIKAGEFDDNTCRLFS